MTWMNRYEVEEAYDRWMGDPVMGPATSTLFNLMRAVDANSDGWPYWTPPGRAASKLQELIQRADQHTRERYSVSGERIQKPTAAEVKKSYAPIKSFMTRRGSAAGMTVTFIEPEGK